MGEYRISELARRCGYPASTLRFYDQAGLLPAERTPGGYRVYGEEAVERLQVISAAKHLGLALEDIRDLLDVWRDGACADVRARLAPLVSARIDDAHVRIAELTAFVGVLAEARERIAGPGPAGRCGPGCGCLDTPTDADPAPRALLPLAPPAGRDRPAPAVACSLDGTAQESRRAEWATVLASAETRTATRDGRRARFARRPGLTATLAALVDAEQECCPFLGFALVVDPGGLELTVTVPPGAEPVLADFFGESS